ncbi:MAG: hypothetical protein NTNFB02_28390 [Nitrospira sp.]
MDVGVDLEIGGGVVEGPKRQQDTDHEDGNCIMLNEENPSTQQALCAAKGSLGEHGWFRSV